jgi:hypothetical protein
MLTKSTKSPNPTSTDNNDYGKETQDAQLLVVKEWYLAMTLHESGSNRPLTDV